MGHNLLSRTAQDLTYLLADGTRALTANWDAGSFKITAETLESDVTTGTAPLVVASTTKVTNLNADLLDGESAAAFQDQDDVLDDLAALSAVSDNEIIVGTGAGTYAHESGATARTSLGLGTGNSPQFTGIELGHATDTTLSRASAGVLAVEGTSLLQADGSIALTSDWDAGSVEIRAQTFESDVATGTAPLVIASTTVVNNLNADLLDGVEGASFLRSNTADVMTGVLTMGDSSAADFEIRFTTDTDTFYAGTDNGTNTFIIGLGTIMGQNPAITILADGTEDVNLGGDLTVSGTGPHAFGGATEADVQFLLTGSFTGSADSTGFTITNTLTTPVNGVGRSLLMASTIIEAASGTHGRISTAEIFGPAITAGGANVTGAQTLHLGGGTARSTTGTAATLRIASTWTGATNNYGIWGDAGLNRFDENVSIGGDAFAGTGTAGLTFTDGTALSNLAANTAGLFANDVSGNVEMFLIDEAGTTTQGTPHNFSLFQPDPSEPFPWDYYSRNPYLGTEINVDLAKLARLVEQLTGEQLIYTRQLPATEHLIWMDTQRTNVARTRQAYEDWELARETFRPMPDTPEFTDLESPIPVVKRPPTWMLSRLQAQGKWDEGAFQAESAQLRRWKDQDPRRRP